VPHFPTIAAIVGSDSSGSALGAGNGQRRGGYNIEVESLAVRLKLVPTGNPWGFPPCASSKARSRICAGS
jgi:hypothetical protein